MNGPLKTGGKGSYNQGMKASGKFSAKGRTIGMNIGKHVGDAKGEKWKRKIGKYGFHSQSGRGNLAFVGELVLALLLVSVWGFVMDWPTLPGAKAQEGSTVNLYQGPPKDPTQTLVFNDGSGNPIYLCVAPSRVEEYSLTVTAASNANPGAFTVTGHGWSLTPLITPNVKVSGGTGNWAAANGTTWIAVPIDANSFSLRAKGTGTGLDTSAFGALTGTIVVRATAPRLNANVWSIKQLFYDGSGNFIGGAWSNGSSAVNNVACSNRASAGIGWQ